MPSDPTAQGPELRALREELDALRRELRPPHRLTLEAGRPRAYLGQPVTVAARVTDAGERPLPGVRVTLVTSWGALRPASGSPDPAAPSAALRTGIDGIARAVLEPHLAEPLSVAQGRALRAALVELDPEAETPEAALPGLREMVRLYRWESNLPLRQAMDLLFRDLRRSPGEAAGSTAALGRWRRIEAAVTAFSQRAEDALGGPVAAAAVAGIEIRDWLDPFLAGFRRVVEEEGDLETGFEGAIGREPASAGGRLLDGAAAAVQEFMGRQRGLLGAEVGRRVAESGIRRFLEERAADLPLDTRIRLEDGLQGASRLLGEAGAAALATVTESRREARHELQGALGGVRGEIDGVRAGLGDLRGDVDGVRTESRAAVRDLRREVSEGLAGSAASVRRIESVVNRNLGALQNVVTGFQVLPANPIAVDRPIRPPIGPIRPGGLGGLAGPTPGGGEDDEED